MPIVYSNFDEVLEDVKKHPDKRGTIYKRYIRHKMQEDKEHGIHSKYEIFDENGMPFLLDENGNKYRPADKNVEGLKIYLTYCRITFPCEYEVLDGTYSIGHDYSLYEFCDPHVRELCDVGSHGIWAGSRKPVFSCLKGVDFSVKLPKTVRAIGVRAFKQTNLQSINLENVNYINACAFEWCSKLKDIKIGTQVTMEGQTIKVSHGAFKGCKGLETAEIREYSEFGDAAFALCPALRNFKYSKIKMFFANAFAGSKGVIQPDKSKYTKIVTPDDSLESDPHPFGISEGRVEMLYVLREDAETVNEKESIESINEKENTDTATKNAEDLRAVTSLFD